MNKTGTFPAKVLDVCEDESESGAYYGLEVEVPALKESLERRLYFGSEEATAVSRRVMDNLGIDASKAPLPQLRSLIGKTCMVRTKVKSWKGTERVEIARMWLANGAAESAGAAIHRALGLPPPKEQSAPKEWHADETEPPSKATPEDDIDQLLK